MDTSTDFDKILALAMAPGPIKNFPAAFPMPVFGNNSSPTFAFPFPSTVDGVTNSHQSLESWTGAGEESTEDDPSPTSSSGTSRSAGAMFSLYSPTRPQPLKTSPSQIGQPNKQQKPKKLATNTHSLDKLLNFSASAAVEHSPNPSPQKHISSSFKSVGEDVTPNTTAGAGFVGPPPFLPFHGTPKRFGCPNNFSPNNIGKFMIQ